jgi:hypothetical protein
MPEARPSHDELLASTDSSTQSLNLGLLAARAAVVLDQKSRGEPADVKPVHQFADALAVFLGLDRSKGETTPEPSAESREKYGLWPLNTAALFQRALVANHGAVEQSFEELMSLARDTAHELAKVGESITPEKASQLRDVSLAISKAAQIQHARVRTPASTRTSR